MLGGLACLSLVLALGDAGYLFAWIRKTLPQMGFMRFPIKFMIPATFVIPLLAENADWVENGLALPGSHSRETGIATAKGWQRREHQPPH